MNNAKLKSKIDGLSSMELKVFNATPKQNYVTAGEVTAILNSGGGNFSQRAVTGVLMHLSEIKVVLETQGKFKGIPFKQIERQPETPQPETKTEGQVIPMIKPQPVKEKSPRSPIEILEEISEMVAQLKDKLDSAAIEIADQIAASEEKSARLKQLQTLLKSLNTD